jgi:hypothetical protein
MLPCSVRLGMTQSVRDDLEDLSQYIEDTAWQYDSVDTIIKS